MDVVFLFLHLWPLANKEVDNQPTTTATLFPMHVPFLERGTVTFMLEVVNKKEEQTTVNRCIYKQDSEEVVADAVYLVWEDTDLPRRT